MKQKYRNTYNVRSDRKPRYDYASRGWYFITICTKTGIQYFGKFIQPTHSTSSTFHATEIGRIAEEYWHEIPNHYPFVKIDAFVLMPDHLHGLIFIDTPEDKPYTPNIYRCQKQNLGTVIGSYKSSVKRFANKNNIPFDWHSGYYDRIVEDIQALDPIRKYIRNNPAKWLQRYGNGK